MNERPDLNNGLDSKVFRSFYYLKEELLAFCKKNGLPTSGGKIELTDRISHYLDTGKILIRNLYSLPLIFRVSRKNLHAISLPKSELT